MTLDSAANSANFVSGSSSTGAFTFTNNTDLRSTLRRDGATDVTIMLASAKVLTISNPVAATSGAVNLFADDVDIAAAVTASNATNGFIRIAPVTAGTNIDLGTDTTLGLTQTDLNQLTAAVAVQIGDTTNTGTITQSQSLAAPAGFTRLDLLSTGAITESAGTTLAVGSISFVTSDAVSYDKVGNQIGTVAASLSVANKAFAFQSDSGLIVGTVGAVVGIDTKSTITVTTTDAATTGQDITISSPVVSSNGNIVFNAGDTMAINSTITTNKAAGTITLNLDFSGADRTSAWGRPLRLPARNSPPPGGCSSTAVRTTTRSTSRPRRRRRSPSTATCRVPLAAGRHADRGRSNERDSQGAGSVTVTGKAVINYSEIETFSVINATGSTVPGTNGNDTIVIQRNGTLTQYNLNCAGFQTVFGNSLTFNGGNGDDSMIDEHHRRRLPGTRGRDFLQRRHGRPGQRRPPPGERVQERLRRRRDDRDVDPVRPRWRPKRRHDHRRRAVNHVCRVEADRRRRHGLVLAHLPAGKDVVALTAGKLFSDNTRTPSAATGTSGGLAFEDHAFRNVSNLTVDTTLVNDDTTAGQGDAITVNAFTATQQVWGLTIVTTTTPFVAGGLDTVTLNPAITITRDPCADDGTLSITTNTITDNGGTITTDGGKPTTPRRRPSRPPASSPRRTCKRSRTSASRKTCPARSMPPSTLAA